MHWERQKLPQKDTKLKNKICSFINIVHVSLLKIDIQYDC
jgi:hypothetical protein